MWNELSKTRIPNELKCIPTFLNQAQIQKDISFPPNSDSLRILSHFKIHGIHNLIDIVNLDPIHLVSSFLLLITSFGRHFLGELFIIVYSQI